MTEKENKEPEEPKHEEKINIIWIELNILSDENTNYYNQLYETLHQKCREYKYYYLKATRSLDEAMEYIKQLKFEATIIIISGILYYDFFVEFFNNMNDIYVIPKILIFTENKNIIKEDKSLNNILDNQFFFPDNKICSSLEDITKFVLEEIVEISKKDPNKEKNNSKDDHQSSEEDGYTFEYIDEKEKLLLPMYYKVLIESKKTNKNNQDFINYIYKESEKNKEKNSLLITSLKSIISIKDIPIQLLSKYYARIYTYNSEFHNILNTQLRSR